jgi:hypothetical protein
MNGFESSGQPPQSGGKRKGIVLIYLTLCLQLTELQMRYKFHPMNPNKNILSANQLFSLIDMKRKFINSDTLRHEWGSNSQFKW